MGHKEWVETMNFYKFWSAHEFRTLFDHALIYILKDEWPWQKHMYYNLVKYKLFSRLLKK